MMPEKLSRSVDVDLNDALKVAEDLLIHLSGLIVNGSSVHRFHHAVRRPAAPLHDVLIRDPDGVHDAGGVMPEVMEAESIRKMGKLQRPAEAVRDLGRIGLDDPAGPSGHFIDYKGRKLNSPVAGIGLGSFDNPFIVRV